MNLLFNMDKKDYDPSLVSLTGDESIVFRRDSARAVIFRDEKLSVIYSQKNNFYKIPGGGIETVEDPIDAMIREVKEESGLTVIRESVKEMGYVHRIQKGKHEPLFIQDNYSLPHSLRSCPLPPLRAQMPPAMPASNLPLRFISSILPLYCSLPMKKYL